MLIKNCTKFLSNVNNENNRSNDQQEYTIPNKDELMITRSFSHGRNPDSPTQKQ